MDYEFRHVRAFLQIAATQNFTKAAESLHISQSALTVQIQQLEDSLGFRVFDRNKRGITLTTAGQEIYTPLQRLLDDAEAIMNSARDIAGVRNGSVTIAALPTVSAGILPEIIKTFSARHTGIRISIVDVVAEKVRDAVLKRHVDFGIGTRFGPVSELMSIPLFRDRLVLFVPADHELAPKQTISLSEAACYGLILPNRDSSVRETVQAIAHRERVTIRPRHETNFLPTALGLVRAGAGVAILPESATGPDSPGLVKIPFDSRAFSRQIELLVRKNRTLSPAAAEFVAHLKQSIQHDSPPKARKKSTAKRPS